MTRRRAVALFLFMGTAFGTAFPGIEAGLAEAAITDGRNRLANRRAGAHR